MSPINFKAQLFKIKSWTIIALPVRVSAQLPSRGMTMVAGTINGIPFQAPLEPDGKGGHWLRVSKPLCNAAGADAGDTVTMAIKPLSEWPEPTVPADLKNALTTVPPAHTSWLNITPGARWDWIRWIHATKQPETRSRRIATACAMLQAGKRRPCCFNRNQCTEPYVSNNGMLLEPTLTAAKNRTTTTVPSSSG